MDKDPTTSFDTVFSTLLGDADSLADGFYESLPDQYANEFPGSTVARIVVSTVPLFRAALKTLEDAHTSLAALALLRPILENWLHLVFIIGVDQTTDSPCRALQLELGWAIRTEGLIRVADPAHLGEIQKRMEEIRGFMGERGCEEKARSYTSIGPDTKKIGTSLGLDWLPGAWQSASQTAHGSGWEWLLKTLDGETVWAPPNPDERAGWLNNLVWIFNQFTQAAYLLVSVDLEQGAGLKLRQHAEGLLEHPLLVASRS